MTRFREEHYASSSYKAALKGTTVSRTNHQSDPFVESEGTPSRSEERRALRSEYFKAQTKGRKAKTPDTQRRLAWRDPGFG